MDERSDYQDEKREFLKIPQEEASYEVLREYFAAKRRAFLGKSQTPPSENTAFLQACNKLYNAGTKLFSASNYELLKQYSQFSEDIVSALRPAVIKTLFSNNKESTEIIENRLLILSILHKNGILKKTANKIADQDWIHFLNSIDAEKLDQYAKVFAEIKEEKIDNPQYFFQIKAHNDLDSLPQQLKFNALLKHGYGIQETLSEESQIKGFTLINEYVCKRTRFFPKHWKQAMRYAWEMPSLEASFDLYKVYSERQNWLDSYLNFPIIHRFLRYFYGKPIFQTFDTEPLTQVCKLLQSVDALSLENFKLLAEMPQTALNFCNLLIAKEIFNNNMIQKVSGIPESILQHICEAKITISTMNLFFRLGKMNIDGTVWLRYKPNWLIISKFSDKSLKMLASLDLNEKIFEKINLFDDLKLLGLFDELDETRQKELLNQTNPEKILALLQHLRTIDLYTPDNIQTIFANQTRLLADNKAYQSILSMEKTYLAKDQKKLNRVIDPRENTATQSREPKGSIKAKPTLILTTFSEEQTARRVAQTLSTLDIKLTEEELGAYSPAVLQAFHASIPLFKEHNLLTQSNIKYMLRVFSSAPNPQERCRCIILLSQCGLLKAGKLYEKIGKLEFLQQENPALFREMYAEAWLQTETSSKWLQQTIDAGLQEPDLSINAEETLIQRYFIENEENSAYLALDDTKHKISTHEYSPMLQQALKLLDKSKLKIESILDIVLLTNAEQIQKIHAWLFILDKAKLLDARNAVHILKNSQNLFGNIDFLKTIVNSLKEHPEFKLSSALQQKHFNQLMSADISSETKQRILDYMDLAIHNPSAAAKFTFIASEIADTAGKKAEDVQDQLKRTAGKLAAATSDMGQKILGKMKLFSSIPDNKNQSNASVQKEQTSTGQNKPKSSQ